MEHGSISLEEFVVESTSTPDLEKDLSALERLFERLRLSQELIERHSHFSEQSYCRSLVCRTTRIDMLILGWQPGQFSSIHDHCDSLNCTRVLSGRLHQRLFRHVEGDSQQALVEMAEEETLECGALTRLDAWGIHQMGNASAEKLVTLHLYARPLAEITVYEAAERKKRRLQLRASYEGEFA